MATERLKVLRQIKRLESQLDRLASDVFMTCSFSGGAMANFWQPPVDVYETDADVVVRLEAPGLHVEDITITLHADTLVVRGVRREPHHDAKTVYHQLEIHYGQFERVVALPRYICHEKAEATYTEGFLIVRIPKRHETPRQRTVVRLRV